MTVSAELPNYRAVTFFLNKCSVKIRWIVVRASLRRYFSYHYTLIFIEYCGDDTNAYVVDRCRGMTRPWVVFCAHSPFPRMFILPLNSTYVQYCISTNTFNKMWMMGTVLSRKILILMYTRCSDFIMSAKKFSDSSSDNSDITKYKWNHRKNCRVLFVTVQTTHYWPIKPDFNPHFSRHEHSALLLGQPS